MLDIDEIRGRVKYLAYLPALREALSSEIMQEIFQGDIPALIAEVERLRTDALIYLPNNEKSGISCVEPMKCMKHMQNIEAEINRLNKENEELWADIRYHEGDVEEVAARHRLKKG